MKLRPMTLAILLGGFAGTAAHSQTADTQAHDQKSEKAAAPVKAATDAPGRADAYYYFTMGHIYEQQYEAGSRAEFATQAIEAYKKAYALDPKSPVIGERLAEIYWKAQRIREAVDEANEILQRNPSDLAPRRLLGRIYLRSLGDFSAGSGQSETVAKAIEQFREIYRVDPEDLESALWLARLYRLRNDPAEAEQVLRAILRRDTDNEAGRRTVDAIVVGRRKKCGSRGAAGGNDRPFEFAGVA